MKASEITPEHIAKFFVHTFVLRRLIEEVAKATNQDHAEFRKQLHAKVAKDWEVLEMKNSKGQDERILSSGRKALGLIFEGENVSPIEN